MKDRETEGTKRGRKSEIEKRSGRGRYRERA